MVKEHWSYGTIQGPRLDYSFYVKPAYPLAKVFNASKDVYVKNELIPGFHHLLELEPGDQIEFKLYPAKSTTSSKNDPCAQGANILSYSCRRTLQQLQSYLINTKDKIGESSTNEEFVISLMSSEAIWLYFFNVTCDNHKFYEEYSKNLLDLIFALDDCMESFPLRKKEIFGLVLEKRLISSITDESLRHSYEFRFIECAVTGDPIFLKDVIPWINRIMDTQSPFAAILYKILMKVTDMVDLSNWKVLDQIPPIKEILGDPLEKGSYLRPILLKAGYKDGNDYLDVYYRLLRAECFTAIQKGITAFRRGKLDPRDMNVYNRVSIVDIDLSHTTILLSLKFNTSKSENWSRCKKLMFGNLLCLTVKGDFSDPIWLTVSDRDDEILQKFNVIGAELISFHSSDLNSAEIIKRLLLNSGNMIMAESPTYFKSFQHVLTSLKECRLEKFGLYNEIVHGRYFDIGLTNLLKSDEASFLTKHLEKINFIELEEHQAYAFFQSLNSRLGLIQGPPGTGKTYVGAKLVHMFLSMQEENELDKILYNHDRNKDADSESSDVYSDSESDVTDDSHTSSSSNGVLTRKVYQCSNSPILVLTYKNHALDEFLKHCIEFCNKEDITRLGSQSKEESLADCQLHVQMKNIDKYSKKPVRQIIENIQMLFEEISTSLEDLSHLKIFNFKSFISHLSMDQISNYARHALKLQWKFKPNWQNIPNYNVMSKFFTEWIQKSQELFKMEILSCIDSLQSNTGESKDYTDFMLEIVSCKLRDAFIYNWLPNKENINKLARLQKMGYSFFNNNINNNTALISDAVDDNNEDTPSDFDVDYINEQEQLRMSAFGLSDKKLVFNQEDKQKRLARLRFKLQNVVNSDKDNNMFTISDFPENCQINDCLLTIDDVWKLSELEKYVFVYSMLHSTFDDRLEKINCILEKIDIEQKKKQSVDEENKLLILKNQKVVGATIVGASVHLSLIKKLAPKIVLVEEAAEILEPCLLAVLTQSVEKLILIGDHKQLKPQVDTYHLRKEYNFHISMMERLIKLEFPFSKLVKQGRMRPEFSCMLKDIYPEYEDFADLSVKNVVIKCLPCSMFFWSHDYDEIKDRSAQNEGEANMVLALALFFIASGVPENEITILCAYLGQVQLIRKMYRAFCTISTPSGTSTKAQINIRTIDEFQGDENRFVIISLTRSNKEKSIGFLKEIERRCVAQSRAKCGMYFVGNAKMFKENPTWKVITRKMELMKLLDDKLPICCFRHPNNKRYVTQSNSLKTKSISDDSQLMYYVMTKDTWCKATCDVEFECNIDDHRCKKSCTPRHDDSKCLSKVIFTFPSCNHTTTKECYVKEENMKCYVDVSFTFSSCSHSTTKKCFFKEKDMKCSVEITDKLECGHDKIETCYKWLNEKFSLQCHELCSKTYSCTSNHSCNKKCDFFHQHTRIDCTALVDFWYPGCKHLVPNYKTQCGKPRPPKKDRGCEFRLQYESETCGHKQFRLCSETEKCLHPCSKLRPDCGHLCTKICFEPCIGGNKPCKLCYIEHKNILDAAKAAAKTQLEIFKKEAADPESFSIINITSNDDELATMKEKCRVFFSLYSKSKIDEIENIWKVKCPLNNNNYWNYATNAFGPVKEELYKIKEGFLEISSMLSSSDLFIQISDPQNEFEFTKYASRSSTSNKKGITQFTLLIMDVLLGDQINKKDLRKNSTEPVDNSNKIIPISQKLKQLKKNSVTETRIGGPASYFVYDGHQVLPKYIVHITCKKKDTKNTSKDIMKKLPDGEHKYDLSSVDLRDHNSPICEFIQKAISLYNGDCAKRPSYKQQKLPSITSVGIIVNKTCDHDYEKKKDELRTLKDEFQEVFAYHATKPENIDSIIKNNLDPKKAGSAHGTAHGKGVYFSEHPQFSFKYGNKAMLVFKLLLVKGHFKDVAPDEKGFCQQLVLNDTSMFKPQYVLYF